MSKRDLKVGQVVNHVGRSQERVAQNEAFGGVTVRSNKESISLLAVGVNSYRVEVISSVCRGEQLSSRDLDLCSLQIVLEILVL